MRDEITLRMLLRKLWQEVASDATVKMVLLSAVLVALLGAPVLGGMVLLLWSAGAAVGYWLLKNPRSLHPRLRSIAGFLFSEKTCTTVFEPIISDIQEEALAEDQAWKARYVTLRGYLAFWSAVWAHCSSLTIRTLLKALGARLSS